MAKKKKYIPREDNDWNEEEAKEHRQIIKDKERSITRKYKKWWDNSTGKWKEGFDGH
tara:strand:- start:151 stop:321 length:171 start_codon:yes stop_codon:yes gene_type:complete